MVSLRAALTPLGLTSFRDLESFTEIPDQSVRRQASRALIMQHHEAIGGVGGPLGIPMGDVRPAGRGFVKPYSGRHIEFLDVTPPLGTHLFRMEVRFVGFRCHQTSPGSGADEPYFIVSIVNGVAEADNKTTRTAIFNGVETGSNTLIGDIITTTARPPFTIHVSAMEHDSGTPDDASAEVEKQLNAAAAKLTLSLAVLGVNPAIGGIVQAFVNIFGGTVGDLASALFGLGDDFIGQSFQNILDFNNEEIAWRTPPPLTAPDFDRPHNVELVLEGGEGGRYSAFFQVDLFADDSVKL